MSLMTDNSTSWGSPIYLRRLYKRWCSDCNESPISPAFASFILLLVLPGFKKMSDYLLPSWHFFQHPTGCSTSLCISYFFFFPIIFSFSQSISLYIFNQLFFSSFIYLINTIYWASSRGLTLIESLGQQEWKIK